MTRVPADAEQSRKLLSVYVHDHLAGAVGGVELAERAHEENANTPFGAPLNDLLAQLKEDAATLREMVRALGFSDHDPIKESAAWLAEKAVRLKMNGQLTGYSPLSRVLELEALSGAVDIKVRLFETLARLAEHDLNLSSFDFPQLIERAERQKVLLGELHARAVPMAFS